MPNLGLKCLLCWCGAFLSPSSKKSSKDDNDYYDLVGVHRDATEAEIRRGYKLKSRQLHPDKVAQREGRVANDSDKAAFQQMKAAYDVLIDPSQRELYDELGLNGLKMMNDPTSLSPEEMIENFQNSSTLLRTRLFLGIVAIVFLFLLAPILACLKVDGKIDGSWFSIMTPLWLYNILYGLLSISMLIGYLNALQNLKERKAAQEAEEDGDDPVYDVDDDMIKKGKSLVIEGILVLLIFFLTLTFEILLFLNLDGNTNYNWITVFIPLYITLLLNSYRLLPYLCFTLNEDDDIMVYASKIELQSEAKRSLIKNMVYALFISLVAIKLDKASDPFFDSWWAVFTPIWVLFAYTCCSSCCFEDSADEYIVNDGVVNEDCSSDYIVKNDKDNEEDEAKSSEVKPGSDDVNPDADASPRENSKINRTNQFESNDGSDRKTNFKTSYESQENKSNVPSEPVEQSSFAQGESSLPHYEEVKSENENMNANTSYIENGSRSSGVCSQLLMLATLLIFCAKLQHDQDNSDNESFSAFWIAVPLLFFPAGLFLCLMGCSIYAVPSSEIEATEDEIVEVINPITDDLAEKGVSSYSKQNIQPDPDPAHMKFSEHAQNLNTTVNVGPNYDNELD